MSTMVAGRDVILSFYDDTAEAYVPLACLTSNGISESQDITEGEANKCDENLPKTLGAYSYEINADGIILASSDTNYSTRASYDKVRSLWETARAAGDPLTWRMAGGNSTQYGEVFITSLDAEFPAEGDATFSVSGSGVGSIVETDPNA